MFQIETFFGIDSCLCFIPIKALGNDIFVMLYFSLLFTFFVNRIEIKYDHENIIVNEEKNEPKICSSSLEKQPQYNASCSDLSLTSTVFIDKRQKNNSVDSGLNDTTNIETTTKRNSVSEIVAM